MKARIVFFLLGLILGSLLQRPALAQQALVIFGVNAGVSKPILVDANGNLQVIVH